jgi:transglutaminase-like putative cysteine protease
MKTYYSILLIFLFAVSLVHAVSYDDKNTLDSVVTFKNSFTIVPTGSSYEIKFINVSLSSYPRSDSRQSVSSITTDPQVEITDPIIFTYANPVNDNYDISVTSRVITRNMVDEVKSQVYFPLTDLDGSLYPYLQPTKIIDVTPDIKNLASELIGDKTDLYEIEYVFAEYVRKNVAYDLGTLTSNVDQKSSWVLENKRGVCDEITNLFISLNRAAGIPARFTSGVAYTNLDDVFGKNWVPHAWAEVYYPGYGWIPYDVTYGQYGFIDAGHIKLLDSQESSSSNVNYNYLGRNIQLKPGAIDIDVDVKNYGENTRGRYEFTAAAYDREAGFGSYDLITVDVKNTQSYYQVADLYLSETQGLSIIENSRETVLNRTIHRKQVLLKPYGSQTVYWMVRVDKNLNSGFIYTMPVTVYNTYNETSVTFIQSKKDYKSYAQDYFETMISSQAEESTKPYSKKIILSCTSDKDSMYIEDAVVIDCVLDNQGDKNFNDVKICMDDECATRDLAVQKVPLHYTKNFKSVGLKNIVIKASNDAFTKVSYVPINVLDKPNVSITDLVYPSTVDYGVPFDMSFKVHKDSSSTPKSLKIVLKSETNKVEWTFPEFDEDKSFTIKSSGDSMKPNTNNYLLTVEYYDEKGQVYTAHEEFKIQSKATFLEDIMLYINLVGRSIEQAFGG